MNMSKFYKENSYDEQYRALPLTFHIQEAGDREWLKFII